MEDMNSISDNVWDYGFLNSTQDHTGMQGSQAPELDVRYWMEYFVHIESRLF